MAAAMPPVDPQTASRLANIPLEVLRRITDYLPTTDLGNMRLTCKAIEGSLFTSFSHEFFRKKQFMVSTFSLQALIDISKHPTLSPCLKHVIIATDRPSLSELANPDSAGAYRAELVLADHKNLMVTGGLRDMLAEAFSNLPNLEVVDIRDFNSRSRTRDGRRAEWRSYGVATLLESADVSIDLDRVRFQDRYPTQLFSAVICALAVAQARPKSIEVLFRGGRRHGGWGLEDEAFFIQPRMESSMAQLLSGLTTLHLSLASLQAIGMPARRVFQLEKFLSLAPNLTWLRLNWRVCASPDSPDLLLPWLALKDTETVDDPTGMTPNPIPLRRLERFDLGNVIISPQTLLRLVAKFSPSLTWLSLRRVSISNSEDKVRAKINPWAEPLSKIAKLDGQRLRTVELSLLGYQFNSFRGEVRICPDKSDPASQYWAMDDKWTCSTNVLTLEKAVDEALEHMIVQWQSEHEDDEDDPEEGDESGQEEDDEEEEGNNEDAAMENID
ncbi:hypothetical protein VTK26DRAFT_9325 [Humicola hyalothermophila]